MLRGALRRPPRALPSRRPAHLPRGHRQLPVPQVLRRDVGRRRAGCRAAACQASRRCGAAHVMHGARSCDRAARLRWWQGKQPAISSPLSWRVAWPGACGTSPLVSWSVRRPERRAPRQCAGQGQHQAGTRRSRRGGGRAGTLACHVWSAQSPRARAPSALLILPVVYIVIVLRGSTSRVIEGHVNSCVTARLQRFFIKIISTTTTLFVSKLK